MPTHSLTLRLYRLSQAETTCGREGQREGGTEGGREGGKERGREQRRREGGAESKEGAEREKRDGWGNLRMKESGITRQILSMMGWP